MSAQHEYAGADGRPLGVPGAGHGRAAAEISLASREELRKSRARFVSAADAERRWIAQNLHDGLQTKLVLLALEAEQLACATGASPEFARAARALRRRIGGAAPGAGLGLRSLADRLDTLGGQLFVTSQAVLGASLRAELPCGS